MTTEVMKTVSLLKTISIIAFVVAAVALAIAIVLFFYFKIPKIAGDLSGMTAKKSIRQMREGNESSGGKSYRPSRVNLERGPITETASQFKPSDQERELNDRIYYEGTNLPQTGILNENRESGRIGDSRETAPLNEAFASTAKDAEDKEGKKITYRLSKEDAATERMNVPRLELINEVIIVHTDEKIDGIDKTSALEKEVLF